MAVVEHSPTSTVDAPPGGLIIVRTPFRAAQTIAEGLSEASWAHGVVPVEKLNGEHETIREDGKVMRGALDAYVTESDILVVTGTMQTFQPGRRGRGKKVVSETDIAVGLYTEDGVLQRTPRSHVTYKSHGDWVDRTKAFGINTLIGIALSDPAAGIPMAVNKQLQDGKIPATIGNVCVGERGGHTGLLFTARQK